MPKGEFEWERSVDRTQKEDWVANMRQSFSEAELVVVTHYIGLNVAELTDFRAKAREVGATFKVTKNRLAKRALAGTRFEGLCDMFAGPTAVACSSDPVAAAKVAADFAKKNDKLVIIGGALGENGLDRSGVAALADLPSLDELRADRRRAQRPGHQGRRCSASSGRPGRPRCRRLRMRRSRMRYRPTDL